MGPVPSVAGILAGVVFEIRTYVVSRGSAVRAAQLLQTVVAPLFADIGVDLVATGAGQTGDDNVYLVLAHDRVGDVAAATERVEALAEWGDGRRDELAALVVTEHRVVVPRAALVGLGLRS